MNTSLLMPSNSLQTIRISMTVIELTAAMFGIVEKARAEPLRHLFLDPSFIQQAEQVEHRLLESSL